MAKYYGTIGYAETVETTPGIWESTITERPYYGDVLRLSRKYTDDSTINGNINVNNKISVIADPYALSNFANIRYVTWMDNKWKVSEITVEYPRLTLTIGGLYNGNDET
jgi:glyceraldehyde-3-phosphate dehydrogenase/erythrose-4-phosphate dehydrogenase